MTIFLGIGAVGIVLLLISLVIGDHVEGVLSAIDAGDWLTGAGLAAFLGALGFVGAIVLDAIGSVPLSVAVGAASGTAVGAATGWLTLKLRHASSGAAPRSQQLLGRTGVVINAIPEGGYGEIRVQGTGQLTKLNAKADQPIASGTEVWIVETLTATSVRVQPTRGDAAS